MAHSIEPVADEFLPRYSPYVRPIALLLLIVSEAFLFTVRFEAPAQFGQGPWWALLIHRSHSIVRLMLVIPIAIAAFGGVRLLVRVRRAVEREASGDERWTRWLVAHGVALAVFTRLTLLVCEGDLASSPYSGGWTLAWVGTGLVVGSTWMAALLSPATWWNLLRRSWRAIVMSVTVSLGSYFLADYTSQLWDSMAGVTLVIVRSMLSLFSSNVTCNPATMDLAVDGFKSKILPACSGFEGIGMILAFLSGYLWWFRSTMRWPQSYVLMPLGVVVIYFLNSARIAALFLIGAWVSPEVAMGAFHSQAGWIAFLGVSLGLVTATRRLSFFAVGSPDSVRVAESNPSAAFLGPFLIVMATSMVTGAFSAGFDQLYGLRVVTGVAALWYFRREFVGLLSGVSWVGVAAGVAAFGLWVALEPASTGSGRTLAQAIGNLPPGQAWAWIALRVIGSVVIIPVVEELAFRGYLTRRLSSVDFQSIPIGRLFWPTLLVSSAAFGMLHGRWFAGMVVGVLYGLVLCRRGKLGDAIAAHAVTNGLIATSVLATGDWTMWT